MDKRFMADVGIATALDVKELAYRFARKYSYQIYRFEETTNRIYLETEWKDRNLFQDEKEANIVQAMSRIFIQARPRARGSLIESKTINRIQFIAENKVLYLEGGEWTTGQITPMVRKYLKRLANDLKTAFLTKTREF